MKIILQWSSRQKQSVHTFELSQQFWKLGLFIFDTMSFINDHVSPVKFFKHRFFSYYHFIRCYTDIPISRHQGFSYESVLKNNYQSYYSYIIQTKVCCFQWHLIKLYPCFLITNKANCFQWWAPFFKLIHPVSQGWFWHYNNVWPRDISEKEVLF